MRSVRRSEKFDSFSSWEFYIFTQIDSARWLGDGYGETNSRLFKLLRYLNINLFMYYYNYYNYYNYNNKTGSSLKARSRGRHVSPGILPGIAKICFRRHRHV